MIPRLRFFVRRSRPVAALAAAGLAWLLCASAMAAAEPAGLPFAQARQRGVLVVGVPYLAPPAVAGAKIRTPERLDGVMATKLGEHLGLPVELVQVEPTLRASVLADGTVDLLLADRVAGQSAPGLDAADVAVVPAGYRARPKAVIRSDTALRNWRQVKGRSVCMSTAAVQAQALAAHWGAIVRTYRVPSDALVAVREGACDIGLVDDTTWAALMQFPEWKKFSATLPLDGPEAERVWLVRADDTAAGRWLAAAMREWQGQGAWRAMTGKWARDVAFDVYLDQEVPDCHGG
ncbi:transporter substrate-binding domain-containing protein [Bordetella sp. BOR01]|uniref:transporter substrate-binding domain-containing protein n=1 Tax=Bordetella sp. BOR01 TaxID=2854779 RepID=UPI001C47944A|nr:transporter substrate-binding domain-containing protein [Bordetella sp. BOR01]MBV7485914.1 transporter substrate-binding domain-containing protein [Bordetella sp. BOR01]